MRGARTSSFASISLSSWICWLQNASMSASSDSGGFKSNWTSI